MKQKRYDDMKNLSRIPHSIVLGDTVLLKQEAKGKNKLSPEYEISLMSIIQQKETDHC